MTQLAVQTPMVAGTSATRVGRAMYRKQVLPLGSINYKGRTLDFTRQMHQQIADSFNAGAYDSVAFQLAPGDNAHTLDPERTRGLVKGFELTNEGLDALIEVTPEGAKVLEDNPSLPVSARINLDLTRADGAHFPAAIQHVLGTLDPRVPGMKPWEKVADLATDQTPVVDLTAASYAPERTGMADLSPEVVAKLTAFASTLDDNGAPAVSDADDTSQLTDDELAALIADVNTDEPVLTGASLSNEQQSAIDLANATADQARQDVVAMRVDLAAAKWERDSVNYLAQGVPPFLVDLAKPVLELPHEAVIELSNTKTVDVAAQVRAMLDGAKGMVDLSTPKGSSSAGTPDDAEARQALIDDYRAFYKGVI